MSFVREQNRNNFPKHYCYYSGLEDTLLYARGKCEDGTIPRKIKRGILVHINDNECAMITNQGKIYEFSTKTGDYKYEGYMSSTIVTEGMDSQVEKDIRNLIPSFNFANGNDERELYYFHVSNRVVHNVLLEPILLVVKLEDVGVEQDVRSYYQVGYSYKLKNPITLCKNLEFNLMEEYDFGELEAAMQTIIQGSFMKLVVTLGKEGTLLDYLENKKDVLETIICQKLQEELMSKYGINMLSFEIEDYNLDGLKIPTIPTAQEKAEELIQEQILHIQSQEKHSEKAFPLEDFMPPKDNGIQLTLDPSWICECGSVNTTNFCGNCGRKKPE